MSYPQDPSSCHISLELGELSDLSLVELKESVPLNTQSWGACGIGFFVVPEAAWEQFLCEYEAIGLVHVRVQHSSGGWSLYQFSQIFSITGLIGPWALFCPMMKQGGEFGPAQLKGWGVVHDSGHSPHLKQGLWEPPALGTVSP